MASGSDHARVVRVLERVGAAVICEERSVDAASFTRTLGDLLADPQRLREMGEAACGNRRLAACDAILIDVGAELAAAPQRRVG